MLVAFGYNIASISGFFVVLTGSSCVGLASTIGETLVLGYLKVFPAILISAWSTGIGCSGVYGSGFYLLMQTLNVSFTKTFLITIP